MNFICNQLIVNALVFSTNVKFLSWVVGKSNDEVNPVIAGDAIDFGVKSTLKGFGFGEPNILFLRPDHHDPIAQWHELRV